MSDEAARTNRILDAEAPALAAALSPLGRRAAFPRGIPFQAAEARGKPFNATIGQITDGHGHAVPLPALAAGLALPPDGPLGDAALDRALLYSPIEGVPELRRAWRERQRRDAPSDEVASSLPLVVDGLTHALSILADLFAGEGRAVAVAAPFWGNYRQTFELRNLARLHTAPAYRDGGFHPGVWEQALRDVPLGQPALAIVNFPSNPGGYSPTPEERRAVVASLVAAAERRPLIVVCDDAYAGLVFDGAVPRTSLFWELVGRHPQLVPVKVDGATKELSFFGGRLGFLTFPWAPDAPVMEALESKVKCLLRATVGSPVAASQVLVLQALARPSLDGEIEAVRRLLEGRWSRLTAALADCDPALLRPLPSNSGCFVLLELPPVEQGGAGLDPEALRRHLLERHGTGLVAVQPRYLRIAHCSLDESQAPELVRRLRHGAEELARA